MSSAKHDIELEEHSNLSFEYVYRDSDGNPVDVTGYGATVLFAEDEESEPFAQGDHNDGWVQIGGTDGVIQLSVPYTAYQNLDIKKGVWQLYIYPTSSDITDRPKRFISGEFVYSKSLL